MNCFLRVSRRLQSIGVSRVALICVNKFERNVNSILIRSQSVRTVTQNVFPTAETLETELSEAKKSGAKINDILKNLVFAHINQFKARESMNTRDTSIVDKVKKLSEEVQLLEIASRDALYSALLEFFTQCEDLEFALAMRDKISPFFRLDAHKVIDLAALLVKEGKVNAAVNMMEALRTREAEQPKSRDSRTSFGILREKGINRLLNALIDKEVEPNLIRKVFDICIELNLKRVNKRIAGPLIKMHLMKRDFSSALKEFVNLADSYQTLPWAVELMRVFIEQNDRDSLNVVVDKCIKAFGPYATALDLSAAYIYTGNIDSAKQEMTRINRIQQRSVELLCDKFIRDNRLEELKTFIELCAPKEGVNKEKLSHILEVASRNSGQQRIIEHDES